MSNLPIADYALLSDCRSAALVSRAGSIDWLCFPRFDGPSVFARLLDDQAGHWSMVTVGPSEVSRRYLERSMVLETTFHTPTGRAVLVDTMAIGHHERGHELGANSPGMLLRAISCVNGSVEVELEYAPRFEYGLIFPQLWPVRGGVMARGGAVVLLLSSLLDLPIEGSLVRARFTLQAGQQARFALQYRASWESELQACSSAAISRSIRDTLRGWRTWSDLHQTYQGPWRELVHHSGRVLQAFMFRPTGAIVAAPTTSLPESIGGERNWDYRYTWVRDASLTLEALWVAACPHEAFRFFNWMAGAVATHMQRSPGLQIMFGVGGEHDLSERTLSHLSGWRGSQPVRIGNGAWKQRQLDIYGELLSAVRLLRGELEKIDEATRQFLVEVADAAAAQWREPDQGIWEVRGEPRHFLYSKLMCWVALDCAIALTDLLRAPDRVDGWTATREQIRVAMLEHGWSEKAQAFTQAFGSDELDASTLMMPIVGFLPATDQRMRATIDAIAERLTDGHGLVYRYRAPDGFADEEGTFLLCTFWLAHAQALAGEVEQARATFERAIAFANDVGLLAEEVDPSTGELLGNFPQAFSHIGLVNAAWAISQARKSTSSSCSW
ncbi:glycoside hydrolase family 15 protein [Dictyobacter kobayashii]|uniref:Trehalase n=1 Tax=Dictyobacter kobayashii TaxID=2014872 RepID=A0A402AQ16_9CHLR|nr:glycoside hydrolase family 15 protein [Dictyobacter kobayashii]GCE21125.1 trehalase [Dictyobacter kobayashii]